MARVTNRMIDPDTGKPFGQDADALSIGTLTKLAPGFSDSIELQTARANGTVPALVAKPVAAPTDDVEIAKTKQAIRDLKDSAKVDPEALAMLNGIAAHEYARADGGRIEIKRALASAGIKKPEAAA